MDIALAEADGAMPDRFIIVNASTPASPRRGRYVCLSECSTNARDISSLARVRAWMWSSKLTRYAAPLSSAKTVSDWAAVRRPANGWCAREVSGTERQALRDFPSRTCK